MAQLQLHVGVSGTVRRATLTPRCSERVDLPRFMDVKGSSADVKGNSVDVKGNSADVKGKSMDVKGYSVSSAQVVLRHVLSGGPLCTVTRDLQAAARDGFAGRGGPSRGHAHVLHTLLRLLPTPLGTVN
eukprot:9271994-Pyramimonas_sp.AAC.2